jgi:CDP-glucose 4,6-dehydratase
MPDRAFWLDRPVFLTGASGLLGSWTVHELLRLGAEVVILLRDRVPRSQLFLSGDIDQVTIVSGALEDCALVERTLNEYEIETVLHMGAQTIVRTANRSPLSTFESNIKGTWNVLEASRVSRLVEQVVVASSDMAYGDQPVLPYTEETPLLGRHPYDVSKSCADMIAQAYHKTYGLPVVITRCGNLYGGGDLNWNRIVPGTIRSVLKGERPIIRSDGTYIRDYFYVKDAVLAYLKLAQRAAEPGIAGEAFNFSNELQLTVSQMVEAVANLMGSNLEPVILGQAPGEIHHQYLSAAKARDVLGWKAEWTLAEGMAETIRWYQEFLGGPGELELTREGGEPTVDDDDMAGEAAPGEGEA